MAGPDTRSVADGNASTLAPQDSSFDVSAFERALDRRLPTRWIGWRLRLLVLAALVGCLGVFSTMRYFADSAYLDSVWQVSDTGHLTLLRSTQPTLATMAGKTLESIAVAGGVPLPIDSLVLQRTARWVVHDAEQYVALQARLAAMLAHGPVQLRFRDGTQVDVAAEPRGFAHLGLAFWPLAALALVLSLIGAAVLLMRPNARNLLYMLMAVSQAGNLLLIGVELAGGLGQPAGFAALDLSARLAFDVVSVAAAVCAFALHPRPIPGATAIVTLMVLSTSAWALLFGSKLLQPGWALSQGLILLLGLSALLVVNRSYQIEHNPFIGVLRRLTGIALLTFTLVTLAIVSTGGQPGAPQGVAAVAAIIWYLFFASLLLLTPFLTRAKHVLREFALLAGISTVTTSLDLLFVALFSLGPFASLTLAMFLALGVYAAARQWILNQTVGTRVLTTERTFEQLYRAAREAQLHPERQRGLLTGLLRELFEPLEVVQLARPLREPRVVGGGSALYVPLPANGDVAVASQTLILRFAGRGKRIFTQDDARLSERIVEQLRSAVAYDKAVEQGRKEERLRIAQDLHDDIGARLLTLMYKAQNPEMEDYIRHTLQDLKTLTRGLAANDHRLSHAAGEWKVDLTNRLTAAGMGLEWDFSADRDGDLNVVQWSGLTRILRELVSNVIYHSASRQVEIQLVYKNGALALTVADDGDGRDPASWSHGLGLGGVRKRVKLLGGQVVWRENGARGIVCEVKIPSLATR